MFGKGYGMPSSHAQFVAYFSLSLTLFLLLRHRPTPSSTHTPLSFPLRLFLSVLSISSAGTVAVSRVYLNYHTPKQVLVGFGAGAIFAIAWFIFTTLLRTSGTLDILLDTWLARELRLRDLVTTEDLVQSGWLRWEQTRKVRTGIQARESILKERKSR